MRNNPARPMQPYGQCFRWANNYALAHPGSTVVHGTVQAPFAKPPHRYAHGWIETADGLVLDWQTMEAHHGGRWMGVGYPIDVFYALYAPEVAMRYSDEQVAVQMLRHKHHGPWHAEVRRNPGLFDGLDGFDDFPQEDLVETTRQPNAVEGLQSGDQFTVGSSKKVYTVVKPQGDYTVFARREDRKTQWFVVTQASHERPQDVCVGLFKQNWNGWESLDPQPPAPIHHIGERKPLRHWVSAKKNPKVAQARRNPLKVNTSALDAWNAEKAAARKWSRESTGAMIKAETAERKRVAKEAQRRAAERKRLDIDDALSNPAAPFKEGYHVSSSENDDKIRAEGLRARRERVHKIGTEGLKVQRAKVYVWDTLDMARWFGDANSDVPFTIWAVNMTGLDVRPDPETLDMSEWSGRFEAGENGGGWICKQSIPPNRIYELERSHYRKNPKAYHGVGGLGNRDVRNNPAKTYKDLPPGVRVKVWWHPEYMRVVLTGEDLATAFSGYKGFFGKPPHLEADRIGKGSDAPYMVRSSGAPKGFGPLLYDVAMELAGKVGLAPDKYGRSPEASRIWEHYDAARPDVAVVNKVYFASGEDTLKALKGVGALETIVVEDTPRDRDETRKNPKAYHGTSGGFTEFDHDRSGLGTHFGTKGAAQHRNKAIAGLRGAKGDTFETRLYWLNIENPLPLHDLGWWNDVEFVELALLDRGLLMEDELQAELVGTEVTEAEVWAFLRERIEEAGFDSVQYVNATEDRGSMSYIVWDSRLLRKVGE